MFKPGEWKLPVELLSTEAAGTNLENLLRIHALVWHLLHKKVCDSGRYFWPINYDCSYLLLVRPVCKGSSPREFEAVPVGQRWRITSCALKPGRTISKLSVQLFHVFPCTCPLCTVLAGSGTGTPNILKAVTIMLVRMGGQRHSQPLLTPTLLVGLAVWLTISGSHCIV